MISYKDRNDELNILECHIMYMKVYRTILWEFPEFL